MTEPTSEPRALVTELDAQRVALRDGSKVSILPMEATDSTRLMRFHSTLSAETTYRRFFFFHPELSEVEVERFTHLDHHDREALVAVAGDEIVAVGRYDRLGVASDAEVAFVVADSWQGRGLGSLLFGRLAQRAVDAGVSHFVAETLPHNRSMLAVFHRTGLPISERIEDGVVHLRIELSPPAGR